MQCCLCNQEADCKNDQQPGYQQSSSFEIYHCSHCSTAFAWPMDVNHQLYELIYSKIDQIHGYERYARYATDILYSDTPLEYLSDKEEIYWGIQQYLKNCLKNEPKILEVGCGFGYLTYALAIAGYDVVGLDISQVAVDKAKRRYGNKYICSDVQDYASKVGPQYDVIILTEVIEHIPDVKSFLASLDLLLSPQGEIVLTTPNRSCYPNHILWETEPPPVHLWWFSETSIEFIAKDMGYDVHFIDYTLFNKGKSFTLSYPKGKPYVSTREPRIDVSGNPMGVYSFKSGRGIKSILMRLGLWNSIRWIKNKCQQYQREKLQVNPKRQYALCAVLKRKT